MLFKHLPLFAIVAASATLTACGQAEEPKAAAPRAEHGVFISSTDCAERGKLTVDQCGQAIDQAIAAHIQTAPVYKSLSQCESAQGPERCDRIGNNEYRARVQAFFVTMGDPATAVPLYAPTKSAAGFRSPSKQELMASDETLKMSHAALTIAHENARLPQQSEEKGVWLGDAADIR